MSRPSRFAVALVAALSTASLILGSGVAGATAGQPTAGPSPLATVVPGTAACTALVEADSAVVAARNASAASPNDTALTTALTTARQGATNRLCATTATATLTPATRTPAQNTALAGQPFTPALSVRMTLTATPMTPLPNQPVTFAVTSGSATFATPTAAAPNPAPTNADGTATAPTLTAGATPGNVVVTASANGANPVTFNLTVTAPPTGTTPAAIAIATGNGQRVAVGQPFGAPLVARVTEGSAATAVAGRRVVFTITGGPATFAGATPTSAALTTNSLGQVEAPTLTAGAAPGTVTVEARADGVTTPATFTLTVLAANGDAPGEDMPGGPNGEEVNPDEEVDQQAADGSEAAAGGDQVEEVPLGSVDTGGWS